MSLLLDIKETRRPLHILNLSKITSLHIELNQLYPIRPFVPTTLTRNWIPPPTPSAPIAPSLIALGQDSIQGRFYPTGRSSATTATPARNLPFPPRITSHTLQLAKSTYHLCVGACPDRCQLRQASEDHTSSDPHHLEGWSLALRWCIYIAGNLGRGCYRHY